MHKIARTTQESIALKLLIAEEHLTAARRAAGEIGLAAILNHGTSAGSRQRTEFRKNAAGVRSLERRVKRLRRLAKQATKPVAKQTRPQRKRRQKAKKI